jgi:hypothetical protein
MNNTKSYQEKLPKIVGENIRKFTGNECVLVKKKLDTSNNQPLNCHNNVDIQVKSYGGTCINGWLLSKVAALTNIGLWRWTYHSIWQTETGEIYDITKDTINTRDYSPFVLDNNRKIDLINGISYNDIVIFEKEDLAQHYADGMKIEVNTGEIFWILSDLTQIRESKIYNGQYRYIRPEFPANYKQLEIDFQVTVKDGKLSSLTGNDIADPKMLFEYSIHF